MCKELCLCCGGEVESNRKEWTAVTGPKEREREMLHSDADGGSGGTIDEAECRGGGGANPSLLPRLGASASMRCFCASLYAVVDSGCEESAITPAIPYRSPGCSAEGSARVCLVWVDSGWLAGW